MIVNTNPDNIILTETIKIDVVELLFKLSVPQQRTVLNMLLESEKMLEYAYEFDTDYFEEAVLNSRNVKNMIEDLNDEIDDLNDEIDDLRDRTKPHQINNIEIIIRYDQLPILTDLTKNRKINYDIDRYKKGYYIVDVGLRRIGFIEFCKLVDFDFTANRERFVHQLFYS